jgi:nucleoside-diphosphate-sugar epimerase
MEAPVPRVAVIGAAGYVGRLLCTQLVEDGASVVGVVRSSSGFLLDQLGIEWIAVEDEDRREPFDVVVNLAYPTSGEVYDYPKQNQELLGLIQRLSSSDGRVLQVSTQAVFGMALEYPQTTGLLPMRRDFLYVETKLELERLLIEQLVGPRLDVVRLGNIWGPGSAAWTGALAQRLIFGEPVIVDGNDGFSNVTDVANLVSYLSFLARRTANDQRVAFHHLAELGDLRWSYWIERMSNQLGVSPVDAPSPAYSMSGKQELRGALAANSPLAIVRELKDARFTGSALRSLVGGLPPRASRTLRRKWTSSGAGSGASSTEPGEDLFLTVLGCDVRFDPVTDPAWTPPLDPDASWQAISTWLDEVGYT